MQDIISAVTEADFNQLYQIEQLAHSVPWSLGTLKNNQGPQYCNFKLSQDAQIVAFCICHRVLDEATLFNLAVKPDRQQQGLGKKLLQYLIDYLASNGVVTLWLEVRQSNTKARLLYQKLGFNEVDKRKNYYPTPTGEREDAIIMALYL